MKLRIASLGAFIYLCTVPNLSFASMDAASPLLASKIDNPDGSWSFQLPAELVPNAPVTRNILTWEYVGQARFSKYQSTESRIREFIVPESRPINPAAQLQKLTRFDQHGRMWRVKSVNQDAWDTALERANINSPENEEDPVYYRHEQESFEPGSVVRWQPQSWTNLDCNNREEAPLTPNETHIWNGDVRQTITGARPLRQKTAARIETTRYATNFADITNPIEVVSHCSAVILRQKFVLTSAHCVSDSDSNHVDVSTVKVCRDDTTIDPGNACIDAADILIPDTYSGGTDDDSGTDFADDWAVIELEETWVNGGYEEAEDMDMSQAGDATLEGLTGIHNLAFPAFGQSCANLGGLTLIHNKEEEPIASIKNKRLKLKIDTSPGHSGSPLYYCPEGNNNLCKAGEKGFVIGLIAGFDAVKNRVVGPKVSSFKDAALAFIND